MSLPEGDDFREDEEVREEFHEVVKVDSVVDLVSFEVRMDSFVKDRDEVDDFWTVDQL